MIKDWKNKKDSPKVVTVVLPKGQGQPLAEKIFEKGYQRLDLHFARGQNVTSKRQTISAPIEKEILKIVCEVTEVEDLFEFIHSEAKIGETEGSMVYVGPCFQATEFRLPDLSKSSA